MIMHVKRRELAQSESKCIMGQFKDCLVFGMYQLEEELDFLGDIRVQGIQDHDGG